MVKTRRHSLYLNPISNALTIFRAPDRFIRWYDLRKAILAAIREHHQIKAAEVYAIEGIGGYPPGECATDDAEMLPKFEAAFAGDPSYFRPFNLYDWHEESGTFRLARGASTA